MKGLSVTDQRTAAVVGLAATGGPGGPGGAADFADEDGDPDEVRGRENILRQAALQKNQYNKILLSSKRAGMPKLLEQVVRPDWGPVAAPQYSNPLRREEASEPTAGIGEDEESTTVPSQASAFTDTNNPFAAHDVSQTKSILIHRATSTEPVEEVSRSRPVGVRFAESAVLYQEVVEALSSLGSDVDTRLDTDSPVAGVDSPPHTHSRTASLSDGDGDSGSNVSALCLGGSRRHSETSLKFERIHVRTKDVDSDQGGSGSSSYTKLLVRVPLRSAPRWQESSDEELLGLGCSRISTEESRLLEEAMATSATSLQGAAPPGGHGGEQRQQEDRVHIHRHPLTATADPLPSRGNRSPSRIRDLSATVLSASNDLLAMVVPEPPAAEGLVAEGPPAQKDAPDAPAPEPNVKLSCPSAKSELSIPDELQANDTHEEGVVDCTIETVVTEEEPGVASGTSSASPEPGDHQEPSVVSHNEDEARGCVAAAAAGWAMGAAAGLAAGTAAGAAVGLAAGAAAGLAAARLAAVQAGAGGVAQVSGGDTGEFAGPFSVRFTAERLGPEREAPVLVVGQSTAPILAREEQRPVQAQAVAVAGPSHWDHTQPAEDPSHPTCSTPPALPLLQKDRHDDIECDTKDDEGNVRNDVFCLDSSCELLMHSDEEDDDNGWGRELARDNVSLCASLIALKGDSRPSVRAEDVAEEVAVESSLQKVEEPPVAPVVEPRLQPTERVLRHSSGPMSRHWSANTESEPEPEASMSAPPPQEGLFGAWAPRPFTRSSVSVQTSEEPPTGSEHGEGKDLTPRERALALLHEVDSRLNAIFCTRPDPNAEALLLRQVGPQPRQEVPPSEDARPPAAHQKPRTTKFVSRLTTIRTRRTTPTPPARPPASTTRVGTVGQTSDTVGQAGRPGGGAVSKPRKEADADARTLAVPVVSHAQGRARSWDRARSRPRGRPGGGGGGGGGVGTGGERSIERSRSPSTDRSDDFLRSTRHKGHHSDACHRGDRLRPGEGRQVAGGGRRNLAPPPHHPPRAPRAAGLREGRTGARLRLSRSSSGARQASQALGGVLGLARPPFERGQTTSLQNTIRATQMETLFDPADVAALRPHVERIPMSPHCAAAINSVKAAQPRDPTPLSNLEYLPPLPDRRPSSTASLTEAIARILQIDPSSVATSPGRTVVTQSRPAPAGSSQLHEQAQPTPSGAGPAQVDDAPALSSLYRPTVSSGGAASTAARSAWRSVPQVRTPRPPLMQRESGSTAGGTGASGAVGLRAAHARRGADSKVQRVSPPAGSVNKSGAHVGRKALWKGRAGRAHYGAHHQGAEVRREREQLDSRTFKIASTMQTMRPAVKTATQIAQLTARLRLRHGCKPRTIQNPVSNDCTQWSLPHIDRSAAYGHPQPEPSRRDREVPVPVSALASPASVPTLSLERQQDRRERK